MEERRSTYIVERAEPSKYPRPEIPANAILRYTALLTSEITLMAMDYAAAENHV